MEVSGKLTVKSVKHHLRRIEYNRTFTFAEMTTILAQIEAVLNSRPLMAIHSHSPEGLQVLTAGHFLVGRALMAAPNKPTSVRDGKTVRELYTASGKNGRATTSRTSTSDTSGKRKPKMWK